jgi:hypothetical protein
MTANSARQHYPAMKISLPISIQIPVLWGEEVFAHSDFGPLNFLVGPNGTGKTLFANQLRGHLSECGIRTRYLSADRLSGLESSAGQFWGNPFTRGFSIDEFPNYKSYGESGGLGVDAFVILKEKMDVRIKIEALLFQLFGRRIRLAEESGFLRPRLQRLDGSAEYQMREAEAHGLKELIVLLTFLYEDTEKCLIIDEPELHLHPQFQSLILQEMRRIAGDPRQDTSKKIFFLITHSPYIVDLRTLEDLRHCIIFQPGRIPRPVTLTEREDEWRMQRLLPRLNTHHKQFFFAARPIFVEGYQDQQLFTLIQEKKGRMLGAAGASFIDVGGKEELDVFFRLCARLGIEAQVIADLDILLEGKLRQSVAIDERCCRFASDKGIGMDLREILGQLEREASIIASEVRQALAECGGDLPSVLSELKAAVGSAEEIQDSTKRVRNLRYCILLAIQEIRSEIELLAPRAAPLIAVLAGRLKVIFEGFRQAGVYVLQRGELENYLPSYTGNRYSVPNALKSAAFDTERDRLLDPGVTSIELEQLYGELSRLLDIATAGPEVILDDQLNDLIGDWIHEIQSGFRRGFVRDVSTLQTYALSQWGDFSRIFEPIEFSIKDSGFECRMRLRSNVDPDQRDFTFTYEHVAANFRLPTRAAESMRTSTLDSGTTTPNVAET